MYPHLLLGDMQAASDAEGLRALGVTHVLNAAGEDARASSEYGAGIEYLELDKKLAVQLTVQLAAQPAAS